MATNYDERMIALETMMAEVLAILKQDQDKPKKQPAETPKKAKDQDKPKKTKKVKQDQDETKKNADLLVISYSLVLTALMLRLLLNRLKSLPTQKMLLGSWLGAGKSCLMKNVKSGMTRLSSKKTATVKSKPNTLYTTHYTPHTHFFLFNLYKIKLIILHL